MEKINRFRESLGLNQEKMASLLGVSRSHLAMYEAGQRDLPTKAFITLSELSRYLLENPKESAKGAKDDAQTAAIRKYLERQIAQIKYQQLKLDKKITETAKKLDDAASQLQLSGFSQARAKKGKALPAPPLNLVTGEASKTLNGKSLELFKDGLKQKMLAFELELLEAELIKL